MRFPSYPAYRPSSIPWLGEIPTHWTEKRFRFAAELNPVKSEVNYLPEETLASFVPMEAVGEYGGLILESEKQIADVKAGYTYFAEGDVVLAKITPCFENGKGALAEGLLNGIAFGTTELHVVRAGKPLDRRFLFYLTMSHPFRKIGEAMMYGAGGQKRVPEDFIKDFRPGLPPLDEQAAIAAFLDRETARIDTLIERKRRFIELLQEKRSALISHAVTRGLNPDVPLKDSGIEWLGRIPAHWEVKRLKFLLKEPLMYGANESAEYDNPEWPRYIRITDLDNNYLREDTFKSLPEDVAAPYLLKDKDLLLARSGATVGKSFLYRKEWGKAAYAGYLIRARLNENVVSPEFVAHYFRSKNYWNWLNSIFIQATIQNVSAEKYANIVLPVPSAEEQAVIVAFLDREATRLDNLRTKVESAIDQLKEYRAALITAAVTGKIDVREAA